MLDVVIECCEELQNLLKEFKNFKHSKELKQSIIRLNTLEEKEDDLFISSMRKIACGREGCQKCDCLERDLHIS